MAKFLPGHVPLSRRAKGTPNKPYVTLEYWYNELMKDWPKLRPQQRSKLAVQLMQMLTNKMKGAPGSPEQSVINAKEAQTLLSEVEGNIKIDASQSSVDPSTLNTPDSTHKKLTDL